MSCLHFFFYSIYFTLAKQNHNTVKKKTVPVISKFLKENLDANIFNNVDSDLKKRTNKRLEKPYEESSLIEVRKNSRISKIKRV